jgi:hypothetical protein
MMLSFISSLFQNSGPIDLSDDSSGHTIDTDPLLSDVCPPLQLTQIYKVNNF